MKNFIFKSSDFGLIKNISIKLETIQKEQRHARADLAEILRLIYRMKIDKDLGNQVDDYFEKDETSPQTDSDEHE